MGKPSVQEERGEKSPVLSLGDNSIRVQSTHSMQDFGIVQVANGNLKKECDYVKHNQHENGWRASELDIADTARDWDGRGSNGMGSVRFKVLKYSDLFARLSSRVQKLKHCSQFSSRSVVARGGEFCNFA